MTSTIPNRFVAKTDFGQFQVRISNRDYITIGAKEGCVQIAYNAKTNTANLDWLGTEKGGCEVSGKSIKGTDTVAMTDLAFTILKQLYPQVNPQVSLIDSSRFTCNIPDGNKIYISNMIYSLLLTGKTYYQSRFNATLEYPSSQPAYDAFVAALNDPAEFDKNYSFGNPELDQALHPLLNVSATWAEFFEKLYQKFGRNTCTIMHAWYMRIFGFLTKNGAIHTHWQIDISRRPNIEYTITQQNNSTNYTRKSYTYNPFEFGGGAYIPSLISYKKYLRRTKGRSRTIRK
jgi:hypothetical protein